MERNLPAEPQVPGAVDDAHAAPADLIQNLVVGDDLSGHRLPGDYTARTVGSSAVTALGEAMRRTALCEAGELRQGPADTR